MFYEKQPTQQQEDYKKMLMIIGNLTLLFSESDCPYLPYRAHENIFCKYLQAENLARSDCSADAKKGRIGIGLKTWMGGDDQKVAEFGKLKPKYASLTGIELIREIAKYRNERIRVTKNLHGIDEMIYHIVKRVPGAMQIIEYAFDYIDIEKISLITNRGNDNNTYFTDGNHIYHFSTSKNTLYMLFEGMEVLDSFEVEIMADPYAFLMNAIGQGDAHIPSVQVITSTEVKPIDRKNTLCLRLYSVEKGEKFVPDKSGLNQWNAGGRKRNPDELYIAYQSEDRKRNPEFFPPRNTPFTLHLPDGTEISAKVCQEADKKNPLIGKSIMSNPNKVLGKWLLRDVFEVAYGTKITYDMLQLFGVDSVVFTKLGELEYSVDFSPLGTYERYYGEDNEDNEDE